LFWCLAKACIWSWRKEDEEEDWKEEKELELEDEDVVVVVVVVEVVTVVAAATFMAIWGTNPWRQNSTSGKHTFCSICLTAY